MATEQTEHALTLERIRELVERVTGANQVTGIGWAYHHETGRISGEDPDGYIYTIAHLIMGSSDDGRCYGAARNGPLLAAAPAAIRLLQRRCDELVVAGAADLKARNALAEVLDEVDGQHSTSIVYCAKRAVEIIRFLRHGVVDIPPQSAEDAANRVLRGVKVRTPVATTDAISFDAVKLALTWSELVSAKFTPLREVDGRYLFRFEPPSDYRGAIPAGQVVCIETPVPPLDEQRAHVDAHKDIEARLSSLEQFAEHMRPEKTASDGGQARTIEHVERFAASPAELMHNAGLIGDNPFFARPVDEGAMDALREAYEKPFPWVATSNPVLDATPSDLTDEQLSAVRELAADAPKIETRVKPDGGAIADVFDEIREVALRAVDRGVRVVTLAEVERNFFETKLRVVCMGVHAEHGACVVDRDEHDDKPHRALDGFEWESPARARPPDPEPIDAESPGSATPAAIEAALRLLPGVVFAHVTTIGPARVHVVVDGGDPYAIRACIHRESVAGMRFDGVERADVDGVSVAFSRLHSEPSSLFCVLCFADDDDGGSWGGGVAPGHCMNCGAGGSVLSLPPWAIAAIRKNASWVGKRYYPSDEDREIREELIALRALVPSFPGRTATEYVDSVTGALYWTVRQETTPGLWESMTFPRLPGETPADGVEKSRLVMRYMPAQQPLRLDPRLEGARVVRMIACPRAKSDTSPCMLRDGDLAVTDDGRCAGCDKPRAAARGEAADVSPMAEQIADDLRTGTFVGVSPSVTEPSEATITHIEDLQVRKQLGRGRMRGPITTDDVFPGWGLPTTELKPMRGEHIVVSAPRDTAVERLMIATERAILHILQDSELTFNSNGAAAIAAEVALLLFVNAAEVSVTCDFQSSEIVVEALGQRYVRSVLTPPRSVWLVQAVADSSSPSRDTPADVAKVREILEKHWSLTPGAPLVEHALRIMERLRHDHEEKCGVVVEKLRQARAEIDVLRVELRAHVDAAWVAAGDEFVTGEPIAHLITRLRGDIADLLAERSATRAEIKHLEDHATRVKLELLEVRSEIERLSGEERRATQYSENTARLAADERTAREISEGEIERVRIGLRTLRTNILDDVRMLDTRLGRANLVAAIEELLQPGAEPQSNSAVVFATDRAAEAEPGVELLPLLHSCAGRRWSRVTILLSQRETTRRVIRDWITTNLANRGIGADSTIKVDTDKLAQDQSGERAPSRISVARYREIDVELDTDELAMAEFLGLRRDDAHESRYGYMRRVRSERVLRKLTPPYQRLSGEEYPTTMPAPMTVAPEGK